MTTTTTTAADSITTFHPAVQDAVIGQRFGIRAAIAVAASASNGLGFALGNAMIPKAEPKASDKIDPRYLHAMGMDGLTPHTPDLTKIADGYIAAQLLVCHFANTPDPDDFGRMNSWAMTYCRTGAQLVENVLDWRAKANIRKAEANLEAFKVAGVKVDLTARAAAIKAEAAAQVTDLAEQADALLLRQYPAMVEKDTEELWEAVVAAFVEMRQPLTRTVYRSLQAIAESQAKRLMAGQYATLDTGIASLLAEIAPPKAPSTDLPAGTSPAQA